jgi:hypothetical protein
MALSFNEEKYPHKNKIKTLFSVMKRKFRESLEARIYRHQVKEIKLKSFSITTQELSLLSHFYISVRNFHENHARRYMMGADAPIPPLR